MPGSTIICQWWTLVSEGQRDPAPPPRDAAHFEKRGAGDRQSIIAGDRERERAVAVGLRQQLCPRRLVKRGRVTVLGDERPPAGVIEFEHHWGSSTGFHHTASRCSSRQANAYARTGSSA